MPNQIRPAEAADREALIALARRTIQACYPAFLGAEAVAGFIDSGAADRSSSRTCIVAVSYYAMARW